MFAIFGAAAVCYGGIAAACIALSRFGGVVAQIWLPNALTVLALGATPARHRVAIFSGAALGCWTANVVFGMAPHVSALLAVANVLEIGLAHGAVGLARGGITERGAQRLALAWILGAVGAPAFTAPLAAATLYWSTDAGFAGFRTFPLVTVLGTICGLLGQSFGGWVVAAGFISLTGLMIVANVKEQTKGPVDPGMTTEVAMLLMFGVGAFLSSNALGIGVGGRWWHLTTNATDSFQQLETYTVDRYGVFLQGSYKFNAATPN